jgi:molecular chaperone GrpE
LGRGAIGSPVGVTIVPSVVADSIEDPVSDSTADSKSSSAPPPIESSAADETNDAQPDEAAEQPDAETTLKAEIARLKDQLLRTLADFDNFRKRTRREIADAERVAREDLLRELLPVFDNLERASQHADAATDIQSLADGIQLVMRQFLDTLAKLGVERVVTVGQPFDPAVHEAVQQVESADLPPGCVAQELLAGYHVGDRLIRPAMVVVARPVTS